MHIESVKRNADMLAAMDELGIPMVDGRIQKDFAHHCLVNWSDPANLANYHIIKKGLSSEAYIAVLKYHINVRMNSEYAQTLVELHRRLGPQELIKFMSGSVATRLEDPTFFDHIRKLRDLLGSTDELSRSCVTALRNAWGP